MLLRLLNWTHHRSRQHRSLFGEWKRPDYSALWISYYKAVFRCAEFLRPFKRPQKCSPGNNSIRSAIFLIPRYFGDKDIFETSDELIQSFNELGPDVSVETIFYDSEEFLAEKEATLRRIISANPSYFIYLYGPNPSFSLSRSQLKALLKQLESRKVVIFTDCIRLSHSYLLYRIKNLFDVIIGIDAPIKFHTGKVVSVGPTAACISRLTFDSIIRPYLNSERDIDVLMLGSRYEERRLATDHLRKNGIEVATFGGLYGKSRISFEEYFRISCRAKIRIVTSFTENRLRQIDPDLSQMKGHITETIASGSLLLVDSANPTSLFFQEGTEFVSYSSLEDLLDKVKWYLDNDDERQRIANAAHERWQRDYLGERFWKNTLLR